MFKFLTMLSRNHAERSILNDADDGERRMSKRQHVQAEVIVEVLSECHTCQLSNVGSGGALLSPSFDVDVGQVVTLRLPNSQISATAGVRRVDTEEIGIQFDDDTVGAIVASWTRGLLS